MVQHHPCLKFNQRQDASRLFKPEVFQNGHPPHAEKNKCWPVAYVPSLRPVAIVYPLSSLLYSHHVATCSCQDFRFSSAIEPHWEAGKHMRAYKMASKNKTLPGCAGTESSNSMIYVPHRCSCIMVVDRKHSSLWL